MSVLDFLFEGKPPPSVTTYGNSTESIPGWLSDYTQGIIGRANAVAGEGYQPYQGPRVADFTPNQQQSFNLTQANIGSYKPGMDLAKSFEEQAGNTSTLGAASPYINRASQTFPEAKAAYMDPYVDDVVNRAELDANRFYNETITPALNKQFTAAGQYGSSQHEREALKASRDLTEGLQSTSLAARDKAYTTAGDQFATDASRLGTLGQLTGQLSYQDAALQGQAGTNIADITKQTSGLQSADEAALAGVGAQQQQMNQQNLDLGYQDFQNQVNYPRQQLDWLNSLVHGMPYDTTSTKTNSAPLPGAAYQPSNSASVLSLLSAIKGMGTNTNTGNFDWSNIFGSGTPTPSPAPADPSGNPFTAGGGWSRGGRVTTESLDDMMALLRSKSSERVPTMANWYGFPEYADEA
jgi:hypothetical protein